MLIKGLRRRRGLSLIELIVALGLTSFLVTTVGFVVVETTQKYAEDRFDSAQTGELYGVMRTLNRDIRLALEFPLEFTAPDGTRYSQSESLLILKLYSLKQKSGQVNCNFFDYLVLRKNGNRLERLSFPDPNSVRPNDQLVLAENLTRFSATVNRPTGSKHRLANLLVGFLDQEVDRAASSASSTSAETLRTLTVLARNSQ